MKLLLIEPTAGRSGSYGTFCIEQALKNAGHQVERETMTKKGFDIELFSIHHVSEFPAVAKMQKKAPYRIMGGHAFFCNPRPLIPFADFICLGEWDTGLKGGLLELGNNPHVIDCKNWINGTMLPPVRVERPLPSLIPYLNFDETRSKAWYIEIARGCPFSCHYCELGHSVQYRPYMLEEIKKAIDLCNLSITRKINLFAPDEASYKNRGEIEEYMQSKGAYMSGFASMRIDSMGKNMQHVKSNVLVRVGVDGLTEGTRKKVNKNITDKDIVGHFRRLLDAGHCNFKIFMIFGYPWEEAKDFDEFALTMRKVFSLPMSKNVNLRVKWTPLIPQPLTPLAGVTAKYDYALVEKIRVWHALNARPRRTPGFFVECDGLQSQKTHALQCKLTTADETFFLE